MYPTDRSERVAPALDPHPGRELSSPEDADGEPTGMVGTSKILRLVLRRRNDAQTQPHQSATSPRGALEVEEPALALRAAGIAAQPPVGAEHAVTRNDDEHRVGPEGLSGVAPALRTVEGGRDVGVVDRLAVGQIRDGPEHAVVSELEGEQVNRQIEAPAGALEVLVKLAADVLEAIVGLLELDSGVGGERAQHRLGSLAVERQTDEAALATDREHHAQRGVEGRVGEASGDGGRHPRELSAGRVGQRALELDAFGARPFEQHVDPLDVELVVGRVQSTGDVGKDVVQAPAGEAAEVVMLPVDLALVAQRPARPNIRRSRAPTSSPSVL